MSIRDELITIVEIADAAHDVDPRPFPDRIVDAILARYAVVELPDPDLGRVVWYVGNHNVVRILPFRTGHKVSAIGDQFHTPAEARALAAALLAAANRAEADT